MRAAVFEAEGHSAKLKRAVFGGETRRSILLQHQNWFLKFQHDSLKPPYCF
jgi:hypothetical protein